MRNLLIWIFTGLLLFAGCSSAGNPTTPIKQPDTLSSSAGSINDLPVIGLTASDDGSFNALGLLGAFELKLDPVNASAELISKRLPSLGESVVVSGMFFFTVSPCSNCLYINSVALTTEGFLELTFGIRHPFAPGDPLKPPTGINRLDLDVFDVALVIKPIGMTPKHFALIGADAYTGILANNAGYTVELKNILSDPTALPYALVVDDSLGTISTFNEFPMGATQTFDVDFDLSGTSTMNFDMYLTMGYGASAQGKANRLNPTYFNPEFNRKPAWKVEVTPPQGTNPPVIGNTWDNSNTTTPYPVKVKIWDWQQGTSTIANPPVNPGDIAFASGVVNVSVEVPGMNTTLQSATTPASGNGSIADPLIYTISFPNQNKIESGKYLSLVKVTDSRVPPTTNNDTDILIHATGGGLGLWNIPEFATYQTFVATVVVGNLPPVCDLVLSKYAAGNGEIISANPGTSMDPEGLIASYEYDIDCNGTTFVPDITQTLGSPGFGNPVNITLPCNTTGAPKIVKIALRVCDGGGPPGVCTICNKDVTEAAKMGDVGDLKVTAVNRSGGNLITSIKLDWADNPCAVEYSIEKASNGWTGAGYASVGTSTTSDYTYTLSGIDWDEDYRFRVIARAVVGGNPASNSNPSEEVFVWFQSNAGQLAAPVNSWGFAQDNGSFYLSSWGGGGPNVDGWPSSGTYVGNGPCCTTTSVTNCWALTRSPQIPDIVGQTEAWADGFLFLNGVTWNTVSGIVIGTLSNPSPGTPATLPDFHVSHSPLGSAPTYFNYNATNVTGLSEFNDTVLTAWQWPSGWQHVGYYLNDLCDGVTGTRDYISIGLVNGSIALSSMIIGWDDSWIFVVQ